MANIRECINNAIDLLKVNCLRKLNESEDISISKLWHLKLADLSDDQIMGGLDRILDKPEPFWPTVGEFKQYCLIAPGCLSFEDEAMEAWAQVFQNLSRWSSPVFKNTVIAETIRHMGGWGYLCSMKDKDAPFRRKDFIAIYTNLKRRNKVFDPALIGRGEVKQRKFIGYQSQEEIKQIAHQLDAEDKNQLENKTKLLEMYANAGG